MTITSNYHHGKLPEQIIETAFDLLDDEEIDALEG
jgi:hypothetical protein